MFDLRNKIKELAQNNIVFVQKVRQVGFSTFMMDYIVEECLKQNTYVNIISNKKSAIKNINKNFLDVSSFSNEKISERDNTLFFSNGSMITSSNINDVVGRQQSKKILWIDEAAYLQNEEDVFMDLQLNYQHYDNVIVNSSHNLKSTSFLDICNNIELGEELIFENAVLIKFAFDNFKGTQSKSELRNLLGVTNYRLEFETPLKSEIWKNGKKLPII